MKMSTECMLWAIPAILVIVLVGVLAVINIPIFIKDAQIVVHNIPKAADFEINRRIVFFDVHVEAEVIGEEQKTQQK